MITEIFDYFGSINTPFRCYKGGGSHIPPAPAPAAVPQEAEAEAAKRDVMDANLRKRGRLASQMLNPAMLLTVPNLKQSGLSDKLGIRGQV